MYAAAKAAPAIKLEQDVNQHQSLQFNQAPDIPVSDKDYASIYGVNSIDIASPQDRQLNHASSIWGWALFGIGCSQGRRCRILKINKLQDMHAPGGRCGFIILSEVAVNILIQIGCCWRQWPCEHIVVLP